MKYALPESAEAVIDRLRAQGYDAYAVGGCVRDMLLGSAPKDWDVCTSAHPEQVIACFPDQRVIQTGIAHGTVTVLSMGQPIEVTTYRVDGSYSDHRRPDGVSFTDNLREDLARRDFTINALAFRPDTGVLDFFGGRADLEAGIIRCVGVPGERFSEDALRILRALRFSSRYRFSIDEETARAMLDQKNTLSFVAAERVFAELCGMDFSAIPARFLPVLREVIPELSELSVKPHVPRTPATQLAALLRGLDADAILKRLRAGNALRIRVALLAGALGNPTPADEVAARKLLSGLGQEAAEQLCQIVGDSAALSLIKQACARGDCFSLKTLAVRGEDIAALGIFGPAIGQALQFLLDGVIEGRLPNEREALLRAIHFGDGLPLGDAERPMPL